ncbi:hypothetical protein WKV44_05035 [Spirochaetia bacterium 38H-sp]|uniref:Uncharacterized protein n=1 Tax=Rarispira pelagica TaxID=3141764 RepID=A0ABU9UB62_9SPIR
MYARHGRKYLLAKKRWELIRLLQYDTDFLKTSFKILSRLLVLYQDMCLRLPYIEKEEQKQEMEAINQLAEKSNIEFLLHEIPIVMKELEDITQSLNYMRIYCKTF